MRLEKLFRAESFGVPAQDLGCEDRAISGNRDLMWIKVWTLTGLRSFEAANDFTLRIDL